MTPYYAHLEVCLRLLKIIYFTTLIAARMGLFSGLS